MSEDWSGWIPVLGVNDMDQSVSFYCDVLGFERDWLHPATGEPPRYAQVSRGRLVLHLSEHGEAHPKASHCVGVPDVDAVYREFDGRGLKAIHPPTDRDYGVRDFAFTDPDGHSYIFSMQIDGFDDSRTT